MALESTYICILVGNWYQLTVNSQQSTVNSQQSTVPTPNQAGAPEEDQAAEGDPVSDF